MKKLIALSCVLLAATATAQHDPWEPVNRKTYAFNEAIDSAVLRPVAVAYDRVSPGWLKAGVSNFFGNLSEVSNFVNGVLQAKPDTAATALGRFVFNTTLGLGGTIDVMSGFGLTEQPEDFGQTLAVWGWADSRYLVLPLFGPSTLRDGVSRFSVDAQTDPLNYVSPSRDALAGTAVDVVSTRASLLGFDQLGGQDGYIVMRSAFLDRRDFLINDGRASGQDDFLDGL